MFRFELIPTGFIIPSEFKRCCNKAFMDNLSSKWYLCNILMEEVTVGVEVALWWRWCEKGRLNYLNRKFSEI